MRTNTTQPTWIKRALATGLLTVTPVLTAISLSPISVADTGSASPITAADASHLSTKAPSQPNKTAHNGAVKHHQHHKHDNHEGGGDSDGGDS